MKNLIKFILLLSVVLLLISCSEDGKLTVINKSSEQIDIIIDGVPYYDLSYNEESETKTWSIAYGEKKDVLITATGYWMLDYYEEATIRPGDDVLHQINSNCGKIQITNNHPSLSVWEVHLSVSTNDDWGDDQLGYDIISPGETYVWYVSSGYIWDVKIVDEQDSTYEIYGDEVLDPEETLGYTFESSSDNIKNSPIKSKFQNNLRKEIAKPKVAIRKIGKVK